jgi:hypothetical protein
LFQVPFRKVMIRFNVPLFKAKKTLSVNIYDTNRLSEKEATKALDKYIKRLEKQKVEGLTEKQVNSLIKIAKALRATLS